MQKQCIFISLKTYSELKYRFKYNVTAQTAAYQSLIVPRIVHSTLISFQSMALVIENFNPYDIFLMKVSVFAVKISYSLTMATQLQHGRTSSSAQMSDELTKIAKLSIILILINSILLYL